MTFHLDRFIGALFKCTGSFEINRLSKECRVQVKVYAIYTKEYKKKIQNENLKRSYMLTKDGIYYY